MFFFTSRKVAAQYVPTFHAELESGYRSTQNLDVPGSNRSSEQSQNYGFGLRGFYLTPNFIQYKAGMRFRQINRKYGDTWTIIRSVDVIDFNTNVLQNRPIAIRLNYKRTHSDYTYGKYSDRTYDNLAGIDLLIQNPYLPGIQLGYVYNSSETDDQRISGTHVSSVRLHRSTDLVSVSAFFLDEQRDDLLMHTFNRHQELQLEGSASLLNRTATLTTNFDFSGYNTYRSTRFGSRFLSTPNSTNRFLIQYNFNSSQSLGSATMSNSLQTDYRRFFTPELTGVVRTTLFRQSQNSSALNTIYINRLFSTGSEYLLIKTKDQVTRRTLANGYVDYNNITATKDQIILRSLGSYQIQQRLNNQFMMSNMYTLAGRYGHTVLRSDYNLNHTFENQLSYLPNRIVLLQNLLTVRDDEGRNFSRSFENRSNLNLRFSHNLSAQTGITTKVTLQPFFHRVDYWNNSAEFDFTRNLIWTAQTTYTLDRTIHVEYGKLESRIQYQLNEFQMSIQGEENIYRDRTDFTFFVSGSRKIGGGLGR